MTEKNWNKHELEKFSEKHASRLSQFGIASYYVKAMPLRLVLSLKGEADRFWQLIEALATGDDLKSLKEMPVQVMPVWMDGVHGVLCTAFNEDPVPA
jgi:hypothetical protein